MKVGVIGQGYVGLNIAIGAANVGHEVHGIDIDPLLISNLSNGLTFIPGITHKKIIDLIQSNNYKPTVNFEEGVKKMLKQINNWKNAPLWNPASIKSATKIWFKYLAK